jgi:hypothetical protein
MTAMKIMKENNSMPIRKLDGFTIRYGYVGMM